MIDDVGFWRRAVSPQEALSIYNAGQAGKTLAQAPQPLPTVPLFISLAGGNLNFSWAGAAGVVLQKTTSLSPVDWKDVAGTSGSSSYSEPNTNAAAYYRLLRP